jgi:hypothetical protein
MNALERLDKYEGEIKVLAERLFEIQDVMQRIMPVVDALVAIAGQDKVLEVASATATKQRDLHVKLALKDCEQDVAGGLMKETDSVEETSLLFIKENDEEHLRILPVASIGDQSVRELLVGAKVGSTVTIENLPNIKVERAFTPVTQQVAE